MSLFGGGNAFGARPAFGATQSTPSISFGAASTPTAPTLGAAAPATPPNPDIELSQPPPDSISALAFSPVANLLAVASWDNSVRIYEIAANGSSTGKASYNHEGPVLDVVWIPDGSKVVSAGADKAARMFDMATGQASQVAAHDQPIKCLRWINIQGGILATGSWDKTVKYWDMRSPTPMATAQLSERCYAMDTFENYIVCATADMKLQVIDISMNPGAVWRTIDSPLKHQIRTVSCFRGQSAPGFAIGSVEGRVAISYIKDEDKNKNFSFKCHRKEAKASEPAQLFAVNVLAFHPVEGTFISAGSDGTMNAWDKDNKIRLKALDFKGGPITAATYNAAGNILAYAVSYDWSHGWQEAGKVPNKVYLHEVKEDEYKRRAKKI